MRMSMKVGMNGEINESDQWLLDGECKKCRRDKYCSKPCKALQTSLRRLIVDGVRSGTESGVIDQAMRHIGE